MNVYVVMGNDYPDCVFTSEHAADAYVTRRMNEPENATKYGGHCVYWRAYQYELDAKVESRVEVGQPAAE